MQLVFFVIGLVIFYLIIRSATGTDKKLEILKSIDDSNKKIELLLTHLVSVKAPIKSNIIDNECDISSGDYLQDAKKILSELRLILQTEGGLIDKNKSFKLGLIRKLYIKQAISKGESEEQANKTYNDLISDLQGDLSKENKIIFIDEYNKGINS